jgi:hypothetical protein
MLKYPRIEAGYYRVCEYSYLYDGRHEVSCFCSKNFPGGSVGSGREAAGKENPRKLNAVGLRTEPALLVRGNSRRITIMRVRPANIRVINRRNWRLDRDLRYLLKEKKKTENSCS